MDELTAALVETGATLAFDAIGGGKLAGQILTCMEMAANKTATGYSRYGSTIHKQVYIYGGLDRSPTEITRNFGTAWGIGGWLLTAFLRKIGPEAAQSCGNGSPPRSRPPLPAVIPGRFPWPRPCNWTPSPSGKQATGEKYLINPHKGGVGRLQTKICCLPDYDNLLLHRDSHRRTVG